MSTAERIDANPVLEPRVWRLTSEAYQALGERGLIPARTELLYGTVYYKVRKTPRHSYVATGLLELFHRALPEGFLLRCESPITMKESEPEPDISVVRGSSSDFIREHPATAELAVEVCDGSYDYDRAKLRAYAQAAVKEVWFVRIPEKQLRFFAVSSAMIIGSTNLAIRESSASRTLLSQN